MGGHGPQPDFAFLMIPMLSEMWLHISTFHTSRSLASMPRRQAAASPARRPLPRAGEALASWPAPRAPSVPRAAVRFPTLPALLSCYLPEVVYLPMPAYGHGFSCTWAVSLRHGALCTAHLLPHTACGEDARACILQLRTCSRRSDHVG